jgi:tripartite-type tricarboxylate transporter receptor subunit TctC
MRVALNRLICAAAILLAGSLAAAAQAFPDKPIRVLVPYPPGGAVDIVARTLTQQMAQDWKTQFVIENRPGAGGVIATEIVAKAPPDGYTLIVVATGHAINPYLYQKLPYDTFKDFTAITELGDAPNILLVKTSLPVKTVGDLIALAKKEPGQLTYGTAGNGTSPHLAGELLKYMARINIVPVPYKGGAPALADLVAGQIPMTFNNIPESIGQIRAGTVRAVAVTTAARSPVLPNVPTVAESGVPGYDTGVWWGVIGPAGLPKPVLAKLHDGFVAALHAPAVTQHLEQLGAVPIGSTPEEFDKLIKTEAAKWAPIIKAAGIKAQ